MIKNNGDSSKVETVGNFEGPLFIVGMQRSGTKLLRNLLNEHSKISIPLVESNCLPYWVERWDTFGDLSDRKNFSAFYAHIRQHPYFLYTQSQVGDLIDHHDWYESCRYYSPAGVFEALIRHDTQVKENSGFIWGDKSPPYINHIPLLKSLFPASRIIHIVRDVRDYCLSVNYAWKKNMLRAAQRWNDSVSRALTSTQRLPNDCLIIRYENLLGDTTATLQKCCDFLDVEFEPSMLQLSRPTENIGHARGKTSVQTNNKQRYLAEMTPELRCKIEAIAAQPLRQLGYEVSYSGEPRRLSKSLLNYYKATDGLAFLWHESQRAGLINILKIELGAYMTAR